MGRYKPGNFVFHDNLIPAEELEPQTGKFGYLLWYDAFRKNNSGELFIEADGMIKRTVPNSKYQALLVRAVNGGVEMEILGHQTLSPSVIDPAKPSSSAIPVKRIQSNGKWYKKYDDEIRYFSIMTMPINKSGWLIERHLIKPSGDAFCTSNLSGVRNKSASDRIPIRRLSKDEYQVEMPRRGWLALRLD